MADEEVPNREKDSKPNDTEALNEVHHFKEIIFINYDSNSKIKMI